TLAGVVGSIATAILPLIAAHLINPTVSILVSSILMGRVVTTLLLFIMCTRDLGLGRLVLPQLGVAKSLLSFGGWTTVGSILGPIMVTFDRFAIGSILGPRSVAYYDIPS